MTDCSAPQGVPSQQLADAVSRRLLRIVSVVSIVGIGIAIAIAYVHLQHQRSGGSYTSFCNVSSRVNCDRVLTSPFAEIFGISVAYLAILAYAFIAGTAESARRADEPRSRFLVRLMAVTVMGSTAFSVYMAIVSLFVLDTLCLLCSGLYLVALVLTGAVINLAKNGRKLGAPEPPPLTPAMLVLWFSLASVAVALAASWGWPSETRLSSSNLSLDELRRADPDFFDWYTSLPVVDPPPGGRHALGDPAAPVTIVEFSDFECAYCRQNHQQLEELIARRPTLVRVVYRHFPLDASCNDGVPRTIHTRACRAAEAAECAADQGRFSQMANVLFENQKELFEANIRRLAKSIGLDTAVFATCMDTHANLRRVVADTKAGMKLHITSTPTLLINGRKVEGSLARPDAYDAAVMIENSGHG